MADTSTDIGTALREARMRAKIDISEVEARTKIRAKYLRAIENEDWEVLPGSVYAKSFLRSYADFLGLDSRMLVEEFKRRYEQPFDQEARPAPAAVPRDRNRQRVPRGPVLPPWALIGLVLVAIVIALYVVGSSTTKTTTTPTTHARHKRHAPKRHGTRTQPAPAPAAPTNVTLQLVPTGTVYVCLVNGSGQKLINQQTYSSGQTIPTQTAQKLLLTLGRAAVRITVNGKNVPVTESSSAIRLLLTPNSIQHISLSMPPTCP
jgi:cytoskeletal protein RodZ